MGFVGGVAERHHKGQLFRLLDVEQLGEGGLVDGTHDAAAHALVPRGQRHVGQRDTGVGVQVTGDGSVLHDGYI